MISRVGRGAVAALAAATLALGSTAPGDAHAVLVRSSPPGRAALSKAPDRVDLWFNERLEAAFSSASVWSAEGTQMDRKDARVDGSDPRRLSVTLAPLAPGAYTLRYRVLSVDGHVVDSSFSFTVKGAPAPK